MVRNSDKLSKLKVAFLYSAFFINLCLSHSLSRLHLGLIGTDKGLDLFFEPRIAVANC